MGELWWQDRQGYFILRVHLLSSRVGYSLDLSKYTVNQCVISKWMPLFLLNNMSSVGQTTGV
jgi:hypothetical protein